MDPARMCPDCGAPLAADAPRGLCPTCLMGAGLSRSAEEGPGARADLTILFEPTGPSAAGAADALAGLAETLGAAPRLLLRDADGASGIDALVQPASPEMPAPTDRSAHLQLFGE